MWFQPTPVCDISSDPLSRVRGDLTPESEDHGFPFESDDHVIVPKIEDHGFGIELESPSANMVDRDFDVEDHGFSDLPFNRQREL